MVERMTPFHHHHWDVLDSTNDAVKRLLVDAPLPMTVVTAGVQTKGRGRRGRVWHSVAGNFHCSVALRPQMPLASAGQLAFVAAVALHEAVISFLPPSQHAALRCKWPNDLLLDGAKLAGMLLENEWPWVIVGVGVNLVDAPNPALYPATSLAAHGVAVTMLDLLPSFCHSLARWSACWETAGFLPVRAAWLDRAAGLGGPMIARLADGQERVGTFEGLDDGGALLLRACDGDCQPIYAGDVFFPQRETR